MAKHLIMAGCVVCFMLVVGVWNQAAHTGQVSGELKKWHKVAVTFDEPQTSETANPNPFMDYRLNASFTHQGSGESKVIRSYYAADGDAANTSDGAYFEILPVPILLDSKINGKTFRQQNVRQQTARVPRIPSARQSFLQIVVFGHGHSAKISVLVSSTLVQPSKRFQKRNSKDMTSTI